MNFQNIFGDASWRLYWPKVAAPHRIYMKHDGKIAALVSLRPRTTGDWSLGKAALEYVVDAERDGRIAEGHVALVALVDNQWSVIATERAGEVRTRIGDTPPVPGRWGDFWWLTVAFQPTTGYRGGGNDEAPF